jgi:hypothetical protein
MAKPPYPGQGTAVPAETGFHGAWVIENEVFLFRADPPRSKGDLAGITRPDGVECDGFDVDCLASMLGITPDELIDLNLRKSLMVEYRRVHPADLGADITIEYFIRTPTTGIRQRIGRAAIRGKA